MGSLQSSKRSVGRRVVGSLVGPDRLSLVCAGRFMVSMRPYYAEKAHRYPVESVEGLLHPRDFGLNAWLNRRFEHLVYAASPLGAELKRMGCRWDP